MIAANIAVLSPETRLALTVIALVGVIAISMLLLIIKRIEKQSPDKIRWR